MADIDLGQVNFIKPKHPVLAKWIKGYYTHYADDQEFYSRLTFFQNVTTTISIYQDSITSSTGRIRRQQYKENSGFSAVLVGLVDKYQEVEFQGPLNRIAIVFYPGGLNHFIGVPLGQLLKKHYSLFHDFDDAKTTFLPNLFDKKNLKEKRDLLDEFFLQRFILLPDPILLRAIDYLTTTEEFPKVDVLANHLSTSRRTLLRKFRKHLGYSIEDYIRVIKFRRALLNYQNNQENLKLGDIALQSNFYDQSDFNHQIKYRSDLTPRELFAQLRIVDDILFWKL